MRFKLDSVLKSYLDDSASCWAFLFDGCPRKITYTSELLCEFHSIIFGFLEVKLFKDLR